MGNNISKLRKLTIQQLAPLAREFGVTRLHSLRKTELVERLFVKLEQRSVETDTPLVDVISQALTLVPAEATAPSQDPMELVRSRHGGSAKKAKGGKGKARDGAGACELANGDLSEEEIQAVIPNVTIDKSPATLSSFALALKRFESQPQSRNLYTYRSQANNVAYIPDAGDDVENESLDLEMIDPYWLHVNWCIRRRSMDRAKAAMGQFWYDAKPILRVTRLKDGDFGTGGRFQHERDIEIHGHINHWFIAVANPPGTYLVEIGYAAKNRFFSLCKSNVVSTPQVRSALRYEKSTATGSWLSACGLQPAQTPAWSPKNHSLYKRWSEKAKRTAPESPSFIPLETPESPREEYPLRILTELLVYGSTSPDSQVTIDSEWVAVQPDGTFMLRLDLPESGRHMYEVDSTSHGKVRTVAFSVERRTRTFRPKPAGAKGSESENEEGAEGQKNADAQV